MSEVITVERIGHVAHVRFNRPERHNALNWDLFQAIPRVTKELTADKTLRAVVVSGNGPSFCSGLDYPEMTQDPGAFDIGFQRGDGDEGNLFQQAAWLWKRVPVPVIAAIHGACYGGGIQIALGADIRIAAADAKLSVMEIKWGLIPDMSGTATLRELVRLDVAKELTYTGRVVTGEEAAALGLVTRVAADPVAEALTMAEAIAQKNPDAIRLGKRVLDANWNQADSSAAMQLEQDFQLKILKSANQLEAARAAMTKTPGNFTDSEF